MEAVDVLPVVQLLRAPNCCFIPQRGICVMTIYERLRAVQLAKLKSVKIWETQHHIKKGKLKCEISRLIRRLLP